ncbi:dihydrolipoamide acetyltransferase family protein [Nocardia sp. NPDC050799]|uniref:dihydrolipoamide acetyltransferase family protein n=1 Tax=Nocardia sp. NPDC050799 TaxID=3154842 RepID=UPI00340508B4
MVEMFLPDVGEGLTEAELSEWLVAPGDVVELNQSVCEIESVKSRVELPSPYAGTVVALAVEEGETVAVGSLLMTIDDGTIETPGVPGSTEAPAATAPAADAGESAAAPEEQKIEVLVGYGPSAPERRAGRRPAATRPARGSAPAAATSAPGVQATPGVRALAEKLEIDLAEVTPEELGTRVTYLDLVRHHDTSRGDAVTRVTGTTGRQEDAEVRTPIRGVRKATAQAVSESAFTAPHVTEFVTIDVTELFDMVARLKMSPRFAGLRVTPLLIAARAVCVALRELPEANATWDGTNNEIVQFPQVNLGIAAATDRGLIVPNIKRADTLGLRGLAAALSELVSTARDGKTSVADMTGGTFTITNVGVFGVEGATPILNRGEAAILALGATLQRPWIVGGEVVPRSVMTLSLSFDHRLVDGELGSRLLVRIGEILTHPAEELAIS